MWYVIVAVVALVAGFWFAHSKYASKLSAVQAQIAKVEGTASADAKALIAKIKSII